MRTSLLAVATVLVAVVVLSVVSRDDGGDASVASPAPTTALPPAEVLDHEDDYDAPPEELIDHADHLDFSRLPEDSRRWIEDELARRQALVDGLWSAYGPGLLGDPAAQMPAELRRLEAYELGYVLVSARAEQLAVAVASAGTLEAARARSEAGPEHPDVEARRDGDCVTVAFAHDPFARAFGATATRTGDASLAQRVEERVRVGEAGAPACAGTPVSYSAAAWAALEALSG